MYTLLVIRPLKLIFPPRSIDVPLIHDDTTIAADTYRHPRDDPDGTRLRAAEREDVARLIETAATADVSWVETAIQIHHPTHATRPMHPAIEDLSRIIVPHFPLVIKVYDDLLGGKGTREVQFSTMGSSGGYLEFVFRESAARLNGTIDFSPEKPLPLKVVRNQDFQEITLSGANGEVLLHFALAYGFRNIQNIIRRIKQKKMTYHFVEIMACPSGCLNGGGQMKEDQEAGGPRVIDRKEILSQLERLYHHDQVEMRGPKSNPSASQIGDWLGGFRSARALDALGAKFQDRSQKKTEQSAINLDF